jgi:hypothetical protein
MTITRKRDKAGAYRLRDHNGNTIACIDKTGVDGRDTYPWSFYFPHHPAIRGGVAATLAEATDIAHARWAQRPMAPADDGHTCPRCRGGIPSDLHRGEYPGALSRFDNKTYVCSSCGMNEAMWQFSTGLPLPDLDKPVSNWPDRASERLTR